MHLIKERLEVEETLNKKIQMILKFQNIKAKVQNGNIISIAKTNLAYIEPHKLIINNFTYLFFNKCADVYINNLEKKIPLNELETHIAMHRN